jgi:hypothetical protein
MLYCDFCSVYFITHNPTFYRLVTSYQLVTFLHDERNHSDLCPLIWLRDSCSVLVQYCNRTRPDYVDSADNTRVLFERSSTRNRQSRGVTWHRKWAAAAELSEGNPTCRNYWRELNWRLDCLFRCRISGLLLSKARYNCLAIRTKFMYTTNANKKKQPRSYGLLSTVCYEFCCRMLSNVY